MVFVKQSLHVTAYEGIRRAIRYDATEQIVIERCQQILNERNIHGATIELTPALSDMVNRGDEITIAITAPTRDNSILQMRFFSGVLEAEATMVKE